MEIETLEDLSISNLILIILDDKNKDELRTNAERELRKRIRNVGWKYDDLLHFDDKVIKKRGLDIDNYVISPNVDMQKLMETYFMYDKDTSYDTNSLLFSEKHLCNEMDFGEPFFKKVCTQEIKNIDSRVRISEIEAEKKLLLSIKEMLLERQKKNKQGKKETFSKDSIFNLFDINESMIQLDSVEGFYHEFLNNISDEEADRLWNSKLGKKKIQLLELLNNTLFGFELPQNLYGLYFVRKDSSKLNRQKKQLLDQAKNGYQVNYESDNFKKVLKLTK